LTQIKKFAGYGSSVAIAALIALALLVSAPKSASADVTAVTITPNSTTSGEVTSYVVSFTAGAGGALAAGGTVTIDFAGTGITGEIQNLNTAGATVTLGGSFSGCTATVSAAVGAPVVTLANATGSTCALANSATGTITLPNIRNGANQTAASLGTVATSAEAVAVAAGNNVAFTGVNASNSVGIGVGANVSSISSNAGSTYLNVYPAADGAAVNVTVSQGVFNTSNSATLTCVDGTASCDADGTANGVVSALYIASGASGTATFNVSASGQAITETLTLQGSASAITVAASPTTIPAAGGTTSTITATVKDANGNNVSDGTSVTITTTLGTLTGNTQSVAVTTTNGTATTTLTGAGNPGVATVTASSGGNSGSTTVTITGSLLELTDVKTQSQLVASGAWVNASTPGTGTPGFRVTVKPVDSAGNRLTGQTATATYSPTTCGTTGTVTSSTATADILIPITIGSAPVGTVCTVTVTSGTKTATATFTKGATTLATLEVDAPGVEPVSSSSITVTGKDSSGNLIQDGTSVTLVVTAGAVATSSVNTVNGVATFTYVSPATAQNVNATAVSGSVTGSDTFNVAVGAGTPAPGTGDGSLSAPNFGDGNVGSAVFDGGTIAELSAAVTAAGGTAVWVQGTDGNWYRYNTLATGATAFVNNAFNAQFSAGLSQSAVFVVK